MKIVRHSRGKDRVIGFHWWGKRYFSYFLYEKGKRRGFDLVASCLLGHVFVDVRSSYRCAICEKISISFANYMSKFSLTMTSTDIRFIYCGGGKVAEMSIIWNKETFLSSFWRSFSASLTGELVKPGHLTIHFTTSAYREGLIGTLVWVIRMFVLFFKESVRQFFKAKHKILTLKYSRFCEVPYICVYKR